MAFITNLTNAVGYTGIYGANGLPSGVDNDQGNIKGGGTIGDTSLFTSSSIAASSGLQVTVVSGVDNTSVLHAGTFNQTSQYQDIVKATTTLAGIANNTLLFGANQLGDINDINQMARVRYIDYKKSVVAGNWNVFSGAFSPALTTTLAGAWNIIGNAEQAGTMITDKTDKAANPSAAEPGHLAYMAGNPVPTTGLYAPRTNW
tara:strand:- start:3765 stop:4373 length:609 start_codon:yes stop_codon:yes gene_type:complete